MECIKDTLLERQRRYEDCLRRDPPACQAVKALSVPPEDAVAPVSYTHLEYFDLDFDYGAVRSQLSAWDPVMAQAARFAPGIRVLKQEPWEALCSFIISQNNNISRIKGIIARLCQCFGDPIPGGGYSFPEAERLCGLSPEELEPLRCGFRAAYIPVSYTHLDVYKRQRLFCPVLPDGEGFQPFYPEWKAALWASQQQDAFPILFLILEGFLVSSFLFREVQKVFFHEQGLPVF